MGWAAAVTPAAAWECPFAAVVSGQTARRIGSAGPAAHATFWEPGRRFVGAVHIPPNVSWVDVTPEFVSFGGRTDPSLSVAHAELRAERWLDDARDPRNVGPSNNWREIANSAWLRSACRTFDDSARVGMRHVAPVRPIGS
jgi:hypothetical protein